MTRLVAVLAALAIAGCGGTDPEPTAVQTLSICECSLDQAGTCIDVPGGSITCGLNIDRSWGGLNQPCPAPDCRMVGNRPASGECNIQVVCGEPLPAQ